MEATLELIPAHFAEILTTASDEHGAPIFAADLAIGGADPSHIEVMAGRWEDGDFEPRSFADELRDFAMRVRQATAPVEIPYDDDGAWGEVAFAWINEDKNTGHKPEGTEYLHDLTGGDRFTDREGRMFTKRADGPVQGACVVTDSEGTFAQLAGETIVKPYREVGGDLHFENENA